MTKLELNDKVAELYFIPKATELGFINGLRQELLLIDDWSRLMDLAVDNKLSIFNTVNVGNQLLPKFATYNGVKIIFNGDYVISEVFGDHESPQAATKYAIAMALVKLKEVE